MASNHSFSNPASKNTQRSITTSSFTDSAGRSETNAARRIGKAWSQGSAQAQPLAGPPSPRSALDLGNDFVAGLMSEDPQRGVWIAHAYGAAGVAGLVARGLGRKK